MKQFKNQVLGTVAFFLLLVGFSNAAQRIDPMTNETDVKQEIREFVTFCTNHGDPR